MTQNINKSAKGNPRTQDFAFDEEYARAMRELHAPLECHSGTNCWRIHGGKETCPPYWDSTYGRAPRCLGCGGKIV